ncbi:MAG: FHA domain-containing protein [Chloroflexota bacterium]
MSSQQPYTFNLMVQTGPTAGQVHAVADYPQTIGRGTGSDIIVPDKTLSRQHVRIQAMERGCVVEDLGSTNGTFVNGQRITGPTLLRAGDTLQIGTLVTCQLQSTRPNLDNLETLAPGRAHFEPVRPAPQKSGNTAWLLMGVIVAGVAVLVGGVLVYLYLANAAPSIPAGPASGQAVQPTPLPPATPAPPASPTPVAELPSPTPKPLTVPGIAAATAIEQPAPADITIRIDPFCNQKIEIAPNLPALVNWSQPLAAADGRNDFLAQWLAAAYYDITLDGRPITDRGAFHYYRSPGPTLNWWVNIGALDPGAHYLRVQWYTSREISSGLDANPADGLRDLFGPGAAGEGFCEIVVPTPALAAATTPGADAPAPTATSSQVFIKAAPLGVFLDFEQQSAWKRGDQPYGELARSTGQVYSGSYAGRLAYDFPSADNDYVVFLQTRPLAERPNALSVWVYGDNSGHYLNVWLKDDNGQTWQMSFGQIKHTGWQELIARLDPDQAWPVGHVSGPDNGVMDYPVSFQAIVLDDAPDSFSGRGVIYLDDLGSREQVDLPTATPTTRPAQLAVTPTVPAFTGRYVLTVGKHIYEPWGAARGGDVCESYRRHDFDDRIQMKGFNLELLLTNNSSLPVADNWSPSFTTAKGRSAQVCYYGYAGSGPQPGATSSITFFTIIELDDYVRVVQLDVNGESIQICLDPAGAPGPC